MPNSSFITPPKIINDLEMRKTLNAIILQIDIAFGNKGSTPFITNSNFSDIEELPTGATLEDVVSKINEVISSLKSNNVSN